MSEKITAQIELDVSRFISEIDKATKAMDNMSDKAKKTGDSVSGSGSQAEKSGGLFSKFGDQVKQGILNGFGIDPSKLVQQMTQYVIEFTKEAVELGTKYDYSLGQVRAVTGATKDEMQILGDEIRRLGGSTMHSAEDIANAVVFLGRAGWKTGEIMSGLSPILDLTTASGEKLEKVADIVSDNLTAWGMSASDTGKYCDILAYATANSNSTVASFGETMKYVAPIASEFGVDVETASAMVMRLSDAGIKGSQAGTTLRSVFTRLASPTKEVAGELERLGIEISNADGTTRPFIDVLGDLNKKYETMSDKQKVASGTTIAGKNAVSGFLKLVGEGSKESLKMYKDGLDNASGSAKKMSDIMDDTSKVKIAKLNSALDELKLRLWDKVKPAFNGVVEEVTKLISELAGLEKKSDTTGRFMTKSFQDMSGDSIKSFQGIKTQWGDTMTNFKNNDTAKLKLDNSSFKTSVDEANGWIRGITNKSHSIKFNAQVNTMKMNAGSIQPLAVGAIGKLEAGSHTSPANTQTIQLQGNWQVRDETDIHKISQGIAKAIRGYYY